MENEMKLSDSQWWNTHTSQKNTEWLVENVNGVDHCVKEMLVLIEQGGVNLAEDVNINHLNKPGLIAHVKEISHRHRLLADHYSNLTGELHTCIQSGTGIQNHGGTLSGPSLLTPNMKQGIHVHSPSSSGGISDASSNAYSGSSSLSSDSDSESFYSSLNDRLSTPSTGKMLKRKTVQTEPVGMEGIYALTKHGDAYDTITIRGNKDYEMLLRRITEYEEELKVSNQKLQLAEEEIAKLKSELQNNESVFLKMGSLEAQLASAENHIKSHEAHIDMENKKSLLLQREVVELEGKLELETSQVLELQESVKKYRTELSVRDLEIKKLSAELQDAFGNFALEKWELESCISKLTDRLTFHVAKNEELQIEFECLADELKKWEDGKVEMEKKKEALEIKWQKEVEWMKAELCKKNELVDTLNQNLDTLKHKHNMLKAEKDGVSSKLQTLIAELSARNNQFQLLEKNLHELQTQSKQFSTYCENAENQNAQLESRIGELENELGKQTLVISERAEEKREAIRQLCFSIDYFRGAYEELRNAYVLQKRRSVVV